MAARWTGGVEWTWSCCVQPPGVLCSAPSEDVPLPQPAAAASPSAAARQSHIKAFLTMSYRKQLYNVKEHMIIITRSPAVAKIADVLVVSDLQGHPRSMISISSDRAYATSC